MGLSENSFTDLSRLSGYDFDAEAVLKAQGAAQSGEFADGDVLAEREIFQMVNETAQRVRAESRAKASPGKIRSAVRQAVKKLFGDETAESKRPYKGDRLRPVQHRYIERFFETGEDIGLGFSMGGGKTRVFLETAGRFLRENPEQFVVISTPQTNLAQQIKQATRDFPSTAHLGASIADDKKMPPHDLKERIAIQAENMDDAEYERHLAEKLPERGKRIIVATPGRILSMLRNGQLDASKVGLLVLDEGGIGSKERTGGYPSFKIVQHLRRAQAHFRTILADATPTQFDYLEEQFGIAKWDFGEDPLFATVLHDSMHVVDETPEHDQIRARFRPLLRSRYAEFRRLFLSPDFQAQLKHHKIQNEAGFSFPPSGQGDIPRMMIEDYEALRKCISKAIKASGKNEAACMRAKNVSLALTAYWTLQRLGETLANKTYYEVAEKIKEYRAAFKDEKARPRLRRIFGLEPGQNLENTRLNEFEAFLRAQINEGMENPKVHELRGLLDEIRKENKKTLVLCNHRGTADWLNFLASAKWGIRCAAIHGSDKTKKNSRRQQFIFEQFRRGEIDVIFATSVAERGLDIPEIDYVISYSPCGNAETQLQSKGRMRRGGTMITLCAPRERFKSYRNKQKARNFWREKRSRAVVDANRQPPDPEAVLTSRFSGKSKTGFFAEEMVNLKKLPLNRAVSERFMLESVSEPEFNAALKSYFLRLRLRDRTGSITYYYNFPSRGAALMAKNTLKTGTAVIALGIMGRTARSGEVYLKGDYDPDRFQEGVIPCPPQDADWDNLGPGVRGEQTPAASAAAAPAPLQQAAFFQKPPPVKPAQGEQLKLF